MFRTLTPMLKLAKYSSVESAVVPILAG